MNLRSLEWRSDRLTEAPDAQVSPLPLTGDLTAWRVRTPSNPDYVWGHFLHFNRAPRLGERDIWCRLFDEAFADLQPRKFYAFSWDTPGGPEAQPLPPDVIDEWMEREYSLREGLVFSTSTIKKPDRFVAELEVKPFDTDLEWSEDLAHRLRLLEYTKQHQVDFLRYRFQSFRALVKAGRGAWYGARLNGRWAGSFGIFWRDGLARFQEVMVDEPLRRRSIARTMCHLGMSQVKERNGDTQFVTLADADGPAVSTYVSLGFRVVEHSVGLQYIDRSQWL